MTQVSPITVVPYMYRDADNYKSHEEVMLAGRITDEEREKVRQALEHPEGDEPNFIPAQIGWPHAAEKEGWNFPGESDHCWHELDVDEIYVVESSNPPPEQTVRDWVNRMVNASADGWDAAQYGL